MLSTAGKFLAGRNLICLARCSTCKILASVNARWIHTGEQQGLGSRGQSSSTFSSHLPRPSALPKRSPPHQDGRDVGAGRPRTLFIRSPEAQSSWARRRRLSRDTWRRKGQRAGHSTDETKGTEVGERHTPHARCGLNAEEKGAAGEGQQREIQSPAALPTLALRDISPDQSPGRSCPRVATGLWPEVSAQPPA